MKLKKEHGLNIVGMNYKDNKENARDFLNEASCCDPKQSKVNYEEFVFSFMRLS